MTKTVQLCFILLRIFLYAPALRLPPRRVLRCGFAPLQRQGDTRHPRRPSIRTRRPNPKRAGQPPHVE